MYVASIVIVSVYDTDVFQTVDELKEFQNVAAEDA